MSAAARPTYIVDESGIPHCSDLKPHRHSSLEAPLICDLNEHRDDRIHHPFLPVDGHPDDDECTHREDGTDATYCGMPEAAHEEPLR